MKKNYFKHFILGLAILLFASKKTFSQTGAALNFDGTNDNVNTGLSINTKIDPTNKITVEAWVKSTSLVNPLGNSLGCIIGNYATNDGGMQFLLRRDGNAYTFWVDCGSGFQVVGSAGGTAIAGVWQHITGVWDGSQTFLYINGILQSTSSGITGSSFVSSPNPIVIGYNNINERFYGDIDEVRIWSTVRSVCQIRSYMNCEIPTNAPGLLANYHFDQAVAGGSNFGSTSLADYAGSGINGTLTNFNLSGATSNWTSPGGVVSGSVTPSAPVIISGALTVNSGSICSGNSFTIVTNSGPTYTVTGGSLVVSPTSNTNYTVMANIGADGCLLSPSVAVSSVTVASLPLPVITVTANTSVVCLNEELILTGIGGSYYKWSMGGVGTNYAFHPMTTATYTVYGYDNNGCYNSATISATVTNCTAIEELTGSNLFSVYPNPSNGEFYLDLNTDNTTVTIFDVVGSIIYTEHLNAGKHQVNLNNYASGLYFIQAKNNSRTSSARMIKE